MHKPRISIIVAMDEKRGIGKNNALMWKIPGELLRFKEITMGHPIIMGRKTFDSIGRVLPGRKNIIITRDPKYTIDNAVIVNSLDEGLIKAQKEENLRTAQDDHYKPEVFIIGGGQIFEQALPQVDRLYLTLVKGDFGADVFFPEYEKDFTKVVSHEDKEVGEYKFSFVTVER
jgi:dihydrofolate reductase